MRIYLSVRGLLFHQEIKQTPYDTVKQQRRKCNTRTGCQKKKLTEVDIYKV